MLKLCINWYRVVDFKPWISLNNKIIPLNNFAISLPIILLFAFISWHLIEKNFLKLKSYRIAVQGKRLIVTKESINLL